ncbi:MAG TPA: hypothetical protein VJL87_00405, partial [Bdellovibrionota bacterium]|nr:hypothetical protein [Bdellovibrionota bacterium]
MLSNGTKKIGIGLTALWGFLFLIPNLSIADEFHFEIKSVENWLRPLTSEVEAVLQADEPNSRKYIQLADIVKKNDPITTLKVASFSKHSDYQLISLLNDASENFLKDKMNNPKEGLFERYRVFEYLVGYLGKNININLVFNFDNILKDLREINLDDFKAAQKQVHGAYFIFRYAYLNHSLSSKLISEIKDLVAYATGYLEENVVWADLKRDELKLVKRRHSEDIYKMIKVRFSEFLEENNKASEVNTIIDGIEYSIDQKTGVIKANVEKNGDLQRISLYWTGSLTTIGNLSGLVLKSSLDGEKTWVIINGIFPLIFNFYLNSFLIQPNAHPMLAEEARCDGANCYNTAMSYYDETTPIEYIGPFEMSDFVEKSFGAYPHSGEDSLVPRDIIIYLSESIFP